MPVGTSISICIGAVGACAVVLGCTIGAVCALTVGAATVGVGSLVGMVGVGVAVTPYTGMCGPNARRVISSHISSSELLIIDGGGIPIAIMLATVLNATHAGTGLSIASNSANSGPEPANNSADSGIIAIDSGNTAADVGNAAADSGITAIDSGNIAADSGSSVVFSSFLVLILHSCLCVVL